MSLRCTGLYGMLAVAVALGSSLSGAAEHPFVMWTPAELKALRQRIETQEWAKAEWSREPENRAEASLRDLLAYRLYGEREAGERQKARLLRTFRSRSPLGGAQWVNVVIYDMVYDLLDDSERVELEKAFRSYIDQAIFRNALFDPDEFNPSRNYQRYDARYYTRTNWLPNITWPRRVSANLMAAALGDEQLIRKVWAHYGSWKWYFDEYLSDGGFYGEEFSKMGATPGAMLVYCRAVRNLGLDELGFGYRSWSGSSMRGHIESVIRLGYPRVELHSGRPHYPMHTTGDLRGEGSSRQGKNLPTFAFQHSIVRGYLPGPSDRDIQRWQAHGAWGGEQRGDNPQWDGYSDFTPKMQLPLWLEAAHAEWPEARLDYFLAQSRTPDEERYAPSLYFGVDPIDAGEVQPPPAPSWVAEDRGLALLRADESPSYWESPKPAVGLRLTANYAHNVNDSLSLSGFYAFGRPIYLNRQTRRGYAFGYSRSILSHCGVLVDSTEPAFTDHVVARHGFYPPAKLLVIESPKLYPEVVASRSLVLTDRYLLDVFRVEGTDGGEHDAIWVVHALGESAPGDPGAWAPVSLDGALKDFQEGLAPAKPGGLQHVTIVQRLALQDPGQASLPPAWYEREIGVRVSLLGAEGLELLVAKTPIDDPENKKLEDPQRLLQLREVGGTSVIARRKAATTRFTALHVPFEGGKAPPLRAVELPTGDDAVVAVEVVDPGEGGSRDWIFVDLRPEEARRDAFSVDIPAAGRVELVDHAFIRSGGGEIQVWGDVRSLRLEGVPETPSFTHNGRLSRTATDGGALVYPPE